MIALPHVSFVAADSRTPLRPGSALGSETQDTRWVVFGGVPEGLLSARTLSVVQDLTKQDGLWLIANPPAALIRIPDLVPGRDDSASERCGSAPSSRVGRAPARWGASTGNHTVE